jgi:dipeptidyl aminopeptidase/acylaminoacyl peptidase
VDAARAAFSLKRRRIQLQSETRTPWQAPEVHIKISPFMYADKIKAPLLPIRGEAGDNSGTSSSTSCGNTSPGSTNT